MRSSIASRKACTYKRDRVQAAPSRDAFMQSSILLKSDKKVPRENRSPTFFASPFSDPFLRCAGRIMNATCELLQPILRTYMKFSHAYEIYAAGFSYRYRKRTL